MFDRLSSVLPPERAEYLHHVFGAAFAGVALLALLLVLLHRGPAGVARAALP